MLGALCTVMTIADMSASSKGTYPIQSVRATLNAALLSDYSFHSQQY